MKNRKQRLSSALENAKRHLDSLDDTSPRKENLEPSKDFTPSRSKLNKLLGRESVQDTRNAKLLQRVGVSSRPTFDLIADHVLGRESRNFKPSIELSHGGNDISDVVADRLANLRERTLSTLEEQSQTIFGDDNNYVGYDHDGVPVWKSVVHGQRRSEQLTHLELEHEISLAAHHHSVHIPKDFDWPKKLDFESHHTFKHWVTVVENRRATQLAEGVVDSPGKGLNPLLIIGDRETGRSHLVHAISQAVLLRHEGHVFLLSGTELEQLESLPKGWQESLVGCSLLAIDDVDMIAENKNLANSIGKMIDYALNLNVHVVLSSSCSPSEWPASRLWDLCRGSVQTIIKQPSAGSLMLFARRKAIELNIVLDDSQLATLVTHDVLGWRSTNSNLEKLASSIRSGEQIVDAHDVSSILSDMPLESQMEHDEIVRERVEDIAQRLISNAVDVVYSDNEIGGIELSSELPVLSEDYEPPNWDIEELSSSQADLLERHVKTTLEDLTPEAPSVLDLHDRDKHLVAQRARIRNEDFGKAADILTDIEMNLDGQFESAEFELAENSVILEGLEQSMLDLAQRASDASLEDLILIADDLRELEQKLVEIDPEKAPLPEFVEAKLIRKPANRRKKKPRTAKTNILKVSSNISSILDSHEPSGEWNIDDSDVSAADLLESEGSQINSLKEIKQTLVPHPEGIQTTTTLTAKSVLITGEEE
jgi:chromosomal replication initiation ATPase DnaA